MWKAISEFGITIHVLNHAYWVSSRINDSTIIQKAVSLKVFSKEEVQAINRVRIALQMVFLSELVLNQSLQVAPKFRGYLLRNHSAISHSWPESYPGSKDFRVWELFLSHISSSTYRLSTQITIQSTNEQCIQSSSKVFYELFSHQS